MLKVKPADGYPPEEGRYLRGNDFSPVAVCAILAAFDSAIPRELNEMVVAGVDAGAAISGMLQTENVGLEKIVCNVVANPNIRYIVLCGRESPGHLPGESLLASEAERGGRQEGDHRLRSTHAVPAQLPSK